LKDDSEVNSQKDFFEDDQEWRQKRDKLFEMLTFKLNKNLNI
jgi:hypothetical protein